MSAKLGRIAAIKHFAVHDGDGIRDTVFFKGCPLACIWCHNPETQSFHTELSHSESLCKACGKCLSICESKAISKDSLGKIKIDRKICTMCGICKQVCSTSAISLIGELWDAKDLAEYIEKDKPFFDESGGGVTLSGGECLSQPEFAESFSRELKKRGISVAVDTCGYADESVIMKMLPLTDLWLYDIKAFDSELHKKLTGKGNEKIISNLRTLIKNDAKIYVRIPLAAGVNDGEIPAIGKLLSSIGGISEVKLLHYSDLSHSKYSAIEKKDTLPIQKTTDADMEKAKKILIAYGLNVK